MRTRCDHGRMSSTICSTVTIGPASRRERAPHALEQRRMERDVAVAVGDRRVERTRRRARAARACRRRPPETASRRGRKSAFASIDDPAIERRDDRGKAARRGLEPLREREERPVLDLDSTLLVRAGEPRVRREVRERVARVAGDHLAHETAAEEQRAEARQAQHHERELRVAAPPLADQFARRGRPARVPDDRVDHVARRARASRPRPRAPVRLSLMHGEPGQNGCRGEVGEALPVMALRCRAARRSPSRACSGSARRSPT